MLSSVQVSEIVEHLERAQNPLFFFDNDNDGLCSFLLLRRFIDRGKGVAIKSFPDLQEGYYRKVDELKPDYIFILDKPLVSDAFLDLAARNNIPVVWIDHHQVAKPTHAHVHYYNPYFVDESNEPVSALAYQVTGKKEDIWLAVIGCISDSFLPPFYADFVNAYSDFALAEPASAFAVLYDSKIGELARILDFALKDTTTHVVAMLKFMMEVRHPSHVFEEGRQTHFMLKRYEDINAVYQKLLERARTNVSEDLIFFSYGGPFSLSANISNQLSHEYPGRIIVVAYTKEDLANVSLRGKDVLDLTLTAIEGIEGATGGGHQDATGAKMGVDDLLKFKERIGELVEKTN